MYGSPEGHYVPTLFDVFLFQQIKLYPEQIKVYKLFHHHS